MAVLKKEEFFDKLKVYVGDKDDDDTLQFLTDVKDTISDYEGKAASDPEDWKQKFEDNDKAWRQKYKDAFFSGVAAPIDTKIEDNADNKTIEPGKTKEETINYDDLFAEKDVTGGNENGNKAE
ncbi:MAG: hypothetical protein IIZ87_03060 [Selenomonas sp.]|nr:hypothetical protein [Selenomonas sp.]